MALLVNSYTHSGIMREVLARHALLGNLTLAGVRGVLIAGSFVYTAILAMVFQLLTFHMMLSKSHSCVLVLYCCPMSDFFVPEFSSQTFSFLLCCVFCCSLQGSNHI